MLGDEAARPGGGRRGSGGSGGGSSSSTRGTADVGSTVSASAPPAAAATAPVGSLPHLEHNHTLPIASLVPLSLSLTLEDFEEVLAEAIFLGNAGAVSEAGGAPQKSEKHPKEEARARTAAAVERMRRGAWNQPGGFFRSEG